MLVSWWRPSTWKSRPPPEVPADPLDRLGSQQMLTAEIEHAVAAARPVSVVLLDLDGFRALRTSRGSAHATRVLRLYAERLERLEQVTSYRLGDDLFAVLIPRGGDPIAWLDALDVDLTRVAGSRVSAGTARVAPGMSALAAQERAVRALRAAKRRGDGSVVDVDRLPEQLEPDITSERATGLLELLNTSYLRVHYQPIVDLATNSTLGFEALARPQLDYGFAGPEDAFLAAEQLGLVPELDAVCRHSIFSDGAGFDMPAHSRLHVNISPHSLGHRSLTTGVLKGHLREVGLTADRVVLELIEQVDLHDPGVDAELRRLARLGFVLALDDVGMAGAGLGLLHTGLFGVVKLAGSVIANAATSPHAVGIIEAVCAYARRTGAMVVAKGVEDADMLSFVRRFRTVGKPAGRIDTGQGFQIGPPQPQARTRPKTSAGTVEPAEPAPS